MMRKLLPFPLLVCAVVCTSCSPRLNTKIVQEYPALDANDRVNVFFLEKSIPSDAEKVAIVKISDSGFSIKACDSTSVMNRIVDESKRVGGNTVLITEHKKPSAMGSSCHQMVATVLNVKDAKYQQYYVEDQEDIESARIEKENLAKQRTLPRFAITAGAGAGWRLGEIDKSLSGTDRQLTKDMKSGFAWNLSANYYFNDTFGIGLVYTSLLSSVRMEASSPAVNFYSKLETDQNMYYIGPDFLVRIPSANKKWLLETAIGFGYTHYGLKMKGSGGKVDLDGGAFGMHINVGGEYRLGEHWGLLANVSTISGQLGKFRMNTNGYKETVKLKKDDRESLAQLHVGLGVRFYIK